MSLFFNSIDQAVESAKAVRETVGGIMSIFEDLNVDITKYTNDKVSLILDSNLKTGMILNASMGFVQNTVPFVLCNNLNGKKRVVGGITIAKDGYPVSIHTKSKQVMCADKDALINQLSEFVSDVSFGNNLLLIMEEDIE